MDQTRKPPEFPRPAKMTEHADIHAVSHQDMEAVIKACERQQL